MDTVLSNDERRVAFGGGKFTNQLDVVKALAAQVGKDKDGPLAVFWGATVARGELLETLFGQHNEDLMAVDGALISVLPPTWFKNLSCVIVGDDEPLYVIADDAKVNGKLMPLNVSQYNGFRDLYRPTTLKRTYMV